MKTQNQLNLTDTYFGDKCKILIPARSYVSQEEVISLKKKYPNYKIKEIGYQSPIGYRYVYAAFN